MKHRGTPIQPHTERVRVRLAQSMHVHAAPEEVFPLLCPVREFDWIPSWDCRLVYTESGVAELGCVFQTHAASSQRPDDGADTWVVSRYEPQQRISFVRVNPLRTILYDIQLRREADGSTSLDWSQEITALGEDGDRHVREQTPEAFAALIANIESMLGHYLRTGEPLEQAA